MNFVCDLKKIRALCVEKNIMDMDDLLDALESEGDSDLIYFVETHTIITAEILRARYHKFQRQVEMLKNK